MDRLIFKIYNYLNDKKLYIGDSLFDDIKEVCFDGSLTRYKTYVLLGKNNNTYFEAKKAFLYETIFGEIVDVKIWKDNIKQVAVKTSIGIKMVLTDSINIETGKNSVFKGYFSKDKKIFYALSVHQIEKLEVKISQVPKRCAFDYALKETKAKVLDTYKNNVKFNTFKIRGVLELIYQNDEIEIEGYFEETKYGNVFIVKNHRKNVSSSELMMEAYISKQIPQKILQKRVVKQLIDYFGSETVEILEKNTERIKEVLPKIKDEKIEYINKKLNTSKFIQELYFFCEKENIDARIATKIYQKFGLSSIGILINNPYELAEIDSSLFGEADSLAISKGYPQNTSGRIKAALKSFLKNESKRKGNVYTDINDIYENFNDYLGIIGRYEEPKKISKSEIKAAIDESIKESNFVIDNEKIYLSYNYAYENFIAKKIKDIVDEFRPPFTTPVLLEEQIDEFSKKFNLANKQKEAVRKAVLSNISILTGGPGTGKTLTVRAIITSIKSLKPNVKIKLCAPTGRAAQRMAEVTFEEASTIHKLLNINSFQLSTEDNEKAFENLKDLDFLIIDEFSMVDLELFYRLLYHLDDKTRLIIVGDYNQLPSVSEGQVLKDLVDSGKIPTTRLTEIFRQGKESDIVDISSKINNKEEIILDKYIKTEKDYFDRDFSFIEKTTVEDIDKTIMKILEDLTTAGKSFRDIQVLNPTNKGEIGTIKLNEDIQKFFNKETEEKIINLATKYKKGDKVIHIENNYDLGVMNGTIGFVEELYNENNEEQNVLAVDYDGRKIVYTLKDIEQIKLAYSVTIHKSQGSEFPIVIIPVHKSNESFLNMNLLYTAITRARNYVICVGDKEVFKNAISKTEINRNSNLIEKLLKE